MTDRDEPAGRRRKLDHNTEVEHSCAFASNTVRCKFHKKIFEINVNTMSMCTVYNMLLLAVGHTHYVICF